MVKMTTNGRNRKDADYLMDLLSSCRSSNYNSDREVDEDYLQFWKQLSQYDNCDDDGLKVNIDNDVDAEYVTFLDNLVACGNSYELQLKDEDGVLRRIRYEEKESSTDERPRKAPRKAKCSLKKEVVGDTTYDIFLKNLKMEGDTIVLDYMGGTVRYGEGDGESLSLACKVEREPTPSWDSTVVEVQNHQPFDTNEKLNFRAQLISALKRPYSQAELEKLQNDANCRKAKSRYMDTRSGGRAMRIHKEGRSYLDQVPGLKEKIEAAEDDPCKTLNLLRGLFFWLKHVAMEGAFYPWNDAECREVMPSI